MPFGSSERDVIQAQALRAVVSANLPFRALRNPEMLKLFGMLRTTAPDIIPSGKVLGGRLLNEAAEKVEVDIKRVMKGRDVGLSTDGWKSKSKDSVNAVCSIVDFKSYLLELLEVTALKKDGPSLCTQFGEMIDRIEIHYGCIIIYFTTDADGGSKKGRILLGKKRPWLILPSCWAHQFQLILGDYFKENDMAAQIAEEATALIGWINNHGKVRKIFDESQATISKDRNAGKIIILVYLVANITRWTTHFVAFFRLFLLRQALQVAALTRRSAIVDAEVGAAVSTEAARLRAEANSFCDKIEDQSFWNGLETVLGDLEPICLGTNINQKDSTRLDQMYRRMKTRPDNTDTPEQRKVKEQEISRAFIKYLSGTGDFIELDVVEWEATYDNVDPIMVWEALRGSKEVAELAVFAIQIFQIVANQAGCERTFSRVKLEQTDHRNRLTLDKLDKRTKISAHILAEHQRASLVKPRKARNNHKSTASLLDVPRYRDLLEDQQDEDPSERGRALVSSSEGWRTQMAKWIGDVKEVDRQERQEREDAERQERATSPFEAAAEEAAEVQVPAGAWKPMSLATLFSEAEKPRARKPSRKAMEEEELLMQALAEQVEDDILDDGAIEIDSDEEFQP
ncbi:ribonuclease H-like domain-containing protein [Mycena sp. CBHHK59/15]|nr:ribonuclease H-like domain-containing protein [Mycena sp. CBHHK59/15]